MNLLQVKEIMEQAVEGSIDQRTAESIFFAFQDREDELERYKHNNLTDQNVTAVCAMIKGSFEKLISESNAVDADFLPKNLLDCLEILSLAKQGRFDELNNIY